jgi:hypothetical protein
MSHSRSNARQLIEAWGALLVAIILGVSSAEADVVTYQKGDGKGAVSETDDITLDETQPDTNLDFPNDSFMCVVDEADHQHCLVKFPNIFGTGPNQIPPGSAILSATLIMYMTDPGNGGTDCPTVYQVAESWVESEGTWNDRQTGVSWTDAGADGPTSRSTSEGIITCDTGMGVYESIDVTTSVQNWSNGEPNEGWVFVNGPNGDGIDYRSSDYGTVAQRPELQVDYVPEVFYSVGTDTNDLKTGSPGQITISSGLATLTVAQTNDIGVGDVIDFDSPSTLVYISSVISPTEFMVLTATGGLPADVGTAVDVNTIKRAFNSITDAVTDSLDISHLGNNDLTAVGRRLTWVCYDDTAFDVSATTTITGYVTDATHYITLTVAGASQVATGNSQRHRGIEGTGARMEATGSGIHMLELDQDNTVVEWLELDGNDENPVLGVWVDAGSGYILRNMILHNFGGGSDAMLSSAVFLWDGSLEMRNIIAYHYDGDGIYTESAGSNLNFFNCTFYGGRSANSEAITCKGTCTGENVIASGPGNNLFNESGATFTLNYCMSEDDSADDYGGTGNLINRVATDQFVSISGTIDLHLKYGADALDAGGNLSGTFTNDIDDETRPATTAWDIGADESSYPAITYYRSIGTEPNLVNEGTITVNAGSVTVTKSGGLGWLAENRGRGDVLIVGADEYMIQVVVSEDELRLAAPADNDYSGGTYTIARQHADLDDWWDCVANNAVCPYFPVSSASLVDDGRSEVGIMYKDPPTGTFLLPGAVSMNSAVTDANHTILLTADPPNRHNGVPGDGVVIDAGGNAYEFKIRTSNFTVEWLEFVGCKNGSSLSPVEVWGDVGDETHNVVLQNLLIHDFYNGNTDSSGIDIAGGDAGTSITVRNTMIWDGDQRGIEGDEPTCSAIIENVSVDGIYQEGIWADKSTFTIRNTVVTNSGVADFDPGSTGTLVGSHNASSDTTAETYFTSSINDVDNLNPVFVTTNVDLHLDPGGSNLAVDAGLDLSASFWNDIDNQVRRSGSSWDIGADERGVVTAVELESFEALPSDSAVNLEWSTGSEIDNLGFHLHRAVSERGPWTLITASLIPGLGSSPQGASYSYRDTGLTNGVTYYYKLEDIETTGARGFHGPVSATPQVGMGEPGEDEQDSRITYGEPESNRWEVRSEQADELVLELITEGFYAIPRGDGTVSLEISGLVLTEEDGSPSLPVKRAWVDVLAGRKVNLTSIETLEKETIDGLRPEQAGSPAVEMTRRGTVRAARSRKPRRGSSVRGLFPKKAAQLLSVGYQEDQKKALVEMAPLRWDENRQRLVLTRRLVVRLSLEGRDPADQVAKGQRARRYRRRPSHEQRRVVTRWVTTEAGLHGVDLGKLVRHGRRLNEISIRLSRQGETVPFHVQDGTLFFVGVGADANPYGNEAVYELEIGVSGQRMATGSAAPSGEPTRFYWETMSKEEDHLYQATLVKAPDRWLWSMLFAPATESYSFEVSSLAVPLQASTLSVWLQGASDFRADPDHHVRIYVNGQFVGEESWNGYQPRRLDVELPAGLLKDGENVLEIENVGDTEASYSMVMLNRFQLRYARKPVAKAGRLKGIWSTSGMADVSGVSPQAILIETHESGPVWLTDAESTASGLRFRAEADRSYLVVSPEAVLPVTLRTPTKNRLKETSQQADYLLVGPRDFLSSAGALVELRRGQGLQVKTVAVEEVFSEFGFGEENPKAIKDFLAYAYHQWQQAPRYVVLLGDASYDFKDHLGTGVENLVPPMMVMTAYLETASDPTYAAVNGEDLLPDLAVGRLPAATVEELERMVNKIVLWETTGQSLRGRVVIVTDDPDDAGNFVGNAETLARTVLGSRPLQKIHLSALGTDETRDAVREAFDDGASLMSYIGHGGIHLWADENIFSTEDVEILSLQSEQPLLLTMNCLNGYFHFPYFDALAEKLLMADGKGVVAAFSPSGLSLDAAAHVFHTLLLEEISTGNHSRLGDAVLAAQAAYADTGRMPELLSIYHLFGDPAMPLQ